MITDPDHAARTVVSPEPDVDCELAEVRWMRSLAAVGMILGAVAMVSLPFGFTPFHQGAFTGDARVNVYDQPLQRSTIDADWLFFSSLLGAGLAGALFLGSLGAMQFRRWARDLLLQWAIGSLIVGAVGTLFCIRWLFAPGREQIAQVRGVVNVLVNFAGNGVGVPWAILMLWILTRPTVKAAFDLSSRGETA